MGIKYTDFKKVIKIVSIVFLIGVCSIKGIKVLVGGNENNFKVVAYYPSWKPNQINKIQYDKLTHINYAFAIPTIEGKLLPLNNEETIKQIIREAHRKNVKVLLSVGGGTYGDKRLDEVFTQVTNTDEKCKKFTYEIINVMNKYGFDGVDIDWEYPKKDTSSQEQYENLIKYLNALLKPEEKLLTIAVPAGMTTSGQEMKTVVGYSNDMIEYVDWINVMVYGGGDGEQHTPLNFVISSSHYWLNIRKIDKEKIVLGIPFYGRPNFKTYEQLVELDVNASFKNEVQEMHYNGISSVKKKTRFALDNLGGVMIWEVTQDTLDKGKSLLNAIYEEIH